MARSCGHDHPPQVHACYPPPCQIAVVVLAAGASTRMGRPKAALPLRRPHGAVDGEPACRRIARVARELDFGRMIVVLGHHEALVRSTCGDLVDFARNPDPARGMFSSVKTGLQVALEVPSAPTAILLWPVDCPLMTVGSLIAMLEAGNPYLAREGLRWVRRPGHRSVAEPTGHPILLSAALARHLLTLPDDARLDHALAHRDVLTHTVLLPDGLHRVNLNTAVDALPFVALEAVQDDVGGIVAGSGGEDDFSR